MNRFPHYFCLLSLLLCSAITGHSQPQIAFETFVSGLSKPVGIAHASDNRLFFVEKEGKIKWVSLVNPGTPQTFLDISDRVDFSGGEEGLLGLAFHRQFPVKPWFYVNYTTKQGRSQVSRFTVLPGSPQLGDKDSEVEVLSVAQPFGNHNGGDLKFGRDGFFYIAFGDGGGAGDPQNKAQNGKTFLGKILRIDVDSGNSYRIPSSNPFVNDPDFEDEIWSLGWRNPWRFSFDRVTGDMWVGDVGQNAYEEIDMEPFGVPGGGNYGWRCYEAFAPFNFGGNCSFVPFFINPVYDYKHPAQGGRSVTGGFVYRGFDIADIKGMYLFGDYLTGQIWLLEKVQGLWISLPQGKLVAPNQLSSFGEDKFGELYAAAINEGKIYKVKSLTTGLDASLQSKPLRVYPVPSSDQVEILIPDDAGPVVVLEVFDALGRLQYSSRGLRTGRSILNVQNWDPGLYMLRLSGDGIYHAKIQVSR